MWLLVKTFSYNAFPTSHNNVLAFAARAALNGSVNAYFSRNQDISWSSCELAGFPISNIIGEEDQLRWSDALQHEEARDEGHMVYYLEQDGRSLDDFW